MKFEIKTAKNKIEIEYFLKFIEKEKIKTDKEKFNELCKIGCKNYGKKYCCPPYSPDFNLLMENKEGLFVVLFKCNLNQIRSTEYNKIRISNSVMKSRIDKLMRRLENDFGTFFFSTGSCRLCRSCKLKSNLPCKFPEKRRYSLEATGVDCNFLSKETFGIPLLWYKNKKSPEYCCVICGLACDEKDSKNIEKKIKELIT